MPRRAAMLPRPLRVVAFSTAEGRERDGTAEIAREVLARAVELDRESPAAVRDFVGRAGACMPP